mgnify:CR=1 FL=1
MRRERRENADRLALRHGAGRSSPGSTWLPPGWTATSAVVPPARSGGTRWGPPGRPGSRSGTARAGRRRGDPRRRTPPASRRVARDPRRASPTEREHAGRRRALPPLARPYRHEVRAPPAEELHGRVADLHRSGQQREVEGRAAAGAEQDTLRGEHGDPVHRTPVPERVRYSPGLSINARTSSEAAALRAASTSWRPARARATRAGPPRGPRGTVSRF